MLAVSGFRIYFEERIQKCANNRFVGKKQLCWNFLGRTAGAAYLADKSGKPTTDPAYQIAGLFGAVKPQFSCEHRIDFSQNRGDITFCPFVAALPCQFRFARYSAGNITTKETRQIFIQFDRIQREAPRRRIVAQVIHVSLGFDIPARWRQADIQRFGLCSDDVAGFAQRHNRMIIGHGNALAAFQFYLKDPVEIVMLQ